MPAHTFASMVMVALPKPSGKVPYVPIVKVALTLGPFFTKVVMFHPRAQAANRAPKIETTKATSAVFTAPD